ncbi:hypothetical protein HNR12_000532 [Streptomonospora nanhaiensis]|uniref:Uncharacterized protein n=1 Tax=Streptomonospora nanhaiensis TaxID=1323731 RepID=A0A853BHN9_9ACTN|nr:hypothetical protein [Streptomonospora nanhaiensis]NYI94255.1 hypothetical protein [Streptomonospora nanhaiensis]
MAGTTATTTGEQGRARAAGGTAGRAGSRPAAVRTAAGVWAAAVALGVAESAVMAADLVSAGTPWGELLPGLGVRAVVYGVVLAVVAALYGGRRWARPVLALGLGVVGTLSLVVEPVTWLLQGGLAEGLPLLTPHLAVVAAPRALHVAAVFAALVLMYRPSANAYFRRG